MNIESKEAGSGGAERTIRFYDGIAHSYDATLGEASSSAWVRAAFHEFVNDLVPPPARVLDFGAGTGTDAVFYGRQGYTVIAYDQSAGMARQATAKVERAGMSGRVRVSSGPFSATLDAVEQEGLVDGVVANFAVFNLVDDLPSLFALLSRTVRPGGLVITSVLNPLFWKDLKESWLWGPALRSFGRGAIHIAGRDTDIYRYRTKTIERAARPGFRMKQKAGVGALVRRVSGSHDWSSPVGLGERIERRMWRRFPMTWFGQYFFLALERRR